MLRLFFIASNPLRRVLFSAPFYPTLARFWLTITPGKF